MRSEFDPKRRAITVGAALALLGFPTITLSGCGGGGGGGGDDGYGGPAGPNPTPTPSSGDLQGTISANHGHAVVITAAQIQAGGAVILNFTGNTTHTHSVDLSADEVVQIRGGGRVSKTSSATNDPSAGNHEHTVTFN